MEFTAKPEAPTVTYEHAVAKICIYMGTGKDDINAFQASLILASMFCARKEDTLEDVLTMRRAQMKLLGDSTED